MVLLGLCTLASFLLGSLASVLAGRFLVERVSLLGSYVGLELSHNPGVAFGMRLPPAFQELLIGIALIAVAWMAVRTNMHVPKARAYALAYGLILGGGLANILDRVRDGLVTDFIRIGTFPIFNVADSCITIGVLMLMLEMFLKKRNEE